MKNQPSKEEMLLERAYVLQNMIRAGRQNLRQQENELKDILAQIEATGQNRFGLYGIITRTQKRRTIISERFFKLWPQAFLRLAKVSIKDATAELGDEQLNASGVCEIKEQVSSEVIRYELPAKKELMV